LLSPKESSGKLKQRGILCKESPYFLLSWSFLLEYALSHSSIFLKSSFSEGLKVQTFSNARRFPRRGGRIRATCESGSDFCTFFASSILRVIYLSDKVLTRRFFPIAGKTSPTIGLKAFFVEDSSTGYGGVFEWDQCLTR
jgi:hypothetical protein